MDLANLDFTIGSVNPSGLSQAIYMANKADIKTWPAIVNEPSAEGATVETMSSYTGAFAMVTGKTFHKIYSTQGKGKLTFESTGETDCKMYTNKGEFYFPRLTPEALAYAKTAANGDFVFLAKHDGRYYLIGSPDYRATCNVTGDTGDSAGSSKGVTISVECPDVSPLPIYTGALVCEEGSLDCATDTLTATGTGA